MDEKIDAGRAGRRRCRCGGQRAGRQLGAQLGGQPFARAHRVHQPDADGDRDARDHDGVSEGLEADAAELPQIAQLGDAERERGDHQRDDQHEEQPEEDPSRRLGQVGNHRIEHRRFPEQQVRRHTERCTDDQAGEHAC